MNTMRKKNQTSFLVEDILRNRFDLERQAEKQDNLLVQFLQIEEYEKIHRPFLNEEKKNVITKKLQIQDESNRKFQLRIQTNDLFFDLQNVKSPKNLSLIPKPIESKKKTKQLKIQSHQKYHFSMQVSPTNKFQSRKSPIKRNTDQPIQVSPLKQKVENLKNVFHNFGNIKDKQLKNNDVKLKKMKEKTNHLSKMIQTIKKQKYANTFAETTRQNSTGEELFFKAIKNKDQLIQSDLTFDQIISIPEKNHYIQNWKSINIFQIIKGDDSKILTKQWLNKYYFSFDSMKDTNNSMKITPFKQISQFSRKLMIGGNIGNEKIINYLTNAELNFQFNNLQFQNILAAASSRISRSLIQQIINNEEKSLLKNNPQNNYHGESSINYLPFQKHQKLMCIDEDQEKHNIEEFIKLPKNNIEKLNQKRYDFQALKIKNTLNKQVFLKAMYIKDKNITTKLNELKEIQMIRLLDTDKKDKKDIDKMIRINKVHKDKSQEIRIKTLLSTVIFKNKYQDKYIRPETTRNKNKEKFWF